MTDWYRFTETYSKSWEFKEDERKDEGIETNDLLYTEELIWTLKNLYIIEGNDEKIEIKDICLALKDHFESCELKTNDRKDEEIQMRVIFSYDEDLFRQGTV